MEPIELDELKCLLDPLTEDEERTLRRSLKRAKKNRDKIKVFTPDPCSPPILLDGFNRNRICKELEIPRYFEEVEEVTTIEEAKRWIVENQLGRRNLAPAVRAELAVKWLGQEQEATNSVLAKVANVSKSTVQRTRRKLRERKRPNQKQSDEPNLNGEDIEDLTPEDAELPPEVEIATPESGPVWTNLEDRFGQQVPWKLEPLFNPEHDYFGKHQDLFEAVKLVRSRMNALIAMPGTERWTEFCIRERIRELYEQIEMATPSFVCVACHGLGKREDLENATCLPCDGNGWMAKNQLNNLSAKTRELLEKRSLKMPEQELCDDETL